MSQSWCLLRNVHYTNGFPYANALGRFSEISLMVGKVSNIRVWISAFENTKDNWQHIQSQLGVHVHWWGLADIPEGQCLSTDCDTRQALINLVPVLQPVASLSAFVWNHKSCTYGGYIGSQSSQHFHQYATLMSPNKGKTAVCGSTIFVWDDWGGDHWFL